jgi:hypothetical protein
MGREMDVFGMVAIGDPLADHFALLGRCSVGSLQCWVVALLGRCIVGSHLLDNRTRNGVLLEHLNGAQHAVGECVFLSTHVKHMKSPSLVRYIEEICVGG